MNNQICHETLGQLQDQVVLRQFLESTLKAALAEVLPTVEQALRQDKAVFWRHWQPLQQHYLAPDFILPQTFVRRCDRCSQRQCEPFASFRQHNKPLNPS